MSKTNKYLINVCIVAVLSALGFVLDRFLSINTSAVKINLAFIPAAFAAILLGPVCAACVWGLTDLIGAILLPFGPYHPGFTVCAALMGAVYGVFLYNKRPDFKQNKVMYLFNMVVPVLINCIVLGLFINTFWISMLYSSKTYWGFFASRLIEYAILVPVQLAVIPVLITLSARLKKQFRFLG